MDTSEKLYEDSVISLDFCELSISISFVNFCPRTFFRTFVPVVNFCPRTFFRTFVPVVNLCSHCELLSANFLADISLGTSVDLLPTAHPHLLPQPIITFSSPSSPS